MRRVGQGPLDMTLGFDVYFHSRVADPRTTAVVELVYAERLLAGVVAAEYSMGWAQLPLFAVRCTPSFWPHVPRPGTCPRCQTTQSPPPV
jgi:hypothetical protein